METDAARHPERFAGLVEHLETFAGRCTGGEPPTVDGGNRGYAIAFYELPEEGLVTAISNGVRFQSLSASLEQELACTVRADQIGAARHLVDVTCGLAIEREQGLELDETLDNGQPLLAATRINGVLVSPHPFFPEEFDVFTDAEGTVTLQVLTLIPVTGPELTFIATHGADALRDRWAELGTDLLDVERDTAVR